METVSLPKRTASKKLIAFKSSPLFISRTAVVGKGREEKESRLIPARKRSGERGGYYSNINLVAAIGEWTWRPARTLLISYKSGVYADRAFTRRVCAQSTVNDVSKLFLFPLFTIHLWRELYDKRARATRQLVTQTLYIQIRSSTWDPIFEIL